MTTQTEDKWQNACEQAQAQFESIQEMVEALEKAQKPDYEAGETEAREDSIDDAVRAIQEDALSVEVRSGWYQAGIEDDSKPTEYRIMLCTGGPAVQITGDLNANCEPETACLQMQDWFLPWTEYRPTVTDCEGDKHTNTNTEEILLAYARQFYFGE